MLNSGLYLVATPIGNINDISMRAIETLQNADIVACEDTRVTKKLFNLLNIKTDKHFISYQDYSEEEKSQLIIDMINQGKSVALVSDAGSPLISDPGYKLVRKCREQNIKVHSIPGACAGIVALTLSALPTGRFCFEGFLSANKGERRERLLELENERRTMIFHEAPHKLKATLEDMKNTFGGERKISLCRS
jgi:16S rRNA (cytidine1402-2'-O)-methyltransferase